MGLIQFCFWHLSPPWGSQRGWKEPFLLLLLVYNPDNIETSASWLGFVSAAAKRSTDQNQIAEVLPLGSKVRAGLGWKEA